MAVNTFQANTGYRDPQKAMTIKALEARAKAAAEATAQAIQPQTIAAPSQGWAQMVGALGANIQQGRAESAAAEGRDALAQAMAGVNMDTGPSMQDIAIIGQHDPELAQRMYEQAMKTRQENLNREDTQEFTAGESLLERQQREKLEADRNALTVSEGALQRKSSEGIATAGNVSSEKIATQNNVSQEGISAADNASQAAISAADNTAAAARTEAEIKARALQDQYNQENDPDSAVGKITHDFNQGVYNIPGQDQSHPETVKRYRDALAAENAKNTPASTQSKMDQELDVVEAKQWGGYQEAGSVASGRLQDLQMLNELGKAAPQGPLVGNALKFAEKFGITGLSDTGAAFNSIVKRMAPQMRVTGTGSTSDLEYRGMLDSLESLSNNPEANQAINAMMQAKARIEIERANIVDQVRNGVDAQGNPFTKQMARAKLSELRGRSIMPPQLRALIEANGGTIPTTDTPPADTDDDILSHDYS